MSAVEYYIESVVGLETSTRPKPHAAVIVLLHAGDTTRSHVYVDASRRRFNTWVTASGIMVRTLCLLCVYFGSSCSELPHMLCCRLRRDECINPSMRIKRTSPQMACMYRL